MRRAMRYLVDGFLQRFAGFERDPTASGDLQSFTGARVASRACRAIANVKRAKTNDLNRFGRLKRFRDHLERCVERSLSFIPGHVCFRTNAIDQFTFVHVVYPLDIDGVETGALQSIHKGSGSVCNQLILHGMSTKQVLRYHEPAVAAF